MVKLVAVLCALVAIPSLGFTCAPVTWANMDQDTSVGSCLFTSCYASRGPTDCKSFKCECKSGFCPFDSSGGSLDSLGSLAASIGKQCLQPTGGTCSLSKFCYHGGITATVCDSGYCMCKGGYHLENGKCVSGEPALLLAANMTDSETEFHLAAEKQMDYLVAKNVMICATWASAVFSAIVAGTVLVYRKRTAAVEDSDEYYLVTE